MTLVLLPILAVLNFALIMIMNLLLAKTNDKLTAARREIEKLNEELVFLRKQDGRESCGKNDPDTDCYEGCWI